MPGARLFSMASDLMPRFPLQAVQCTSCLLVLFCGALADGTRSSQASDALRLRLTKHSSRQVLPRMHVCLKIGYSRSHRSLCYVHGCTAVYHRCPCDVSKAGAVFLIALFGTDAWCKAVPWINIMLLCASFEGQKHTHQTAHQAGKACNGMQSLHNLQCTVDAPLSLSKSGIMSRIVDGLA